MKTSLVITFQKTKISPLIKKKNAPVSLATALQQINVYKHSCQINEQH